MSKGMSGTCNRCGCPAPFDTRTEQSTADHRKSITCLHFSLERAVRRIDELERRLARLERAAPPPAEPGG